MKSGHKVVVALSGGIDSAVTAALLIEQGFKVVGVHMRLLDSAGGDADARRVATELGIEFHSIDCRSQFNQLVVENFCAEYQRGRTPNPCVLCNKYLKFGRLLEVVEQLGADFLATGHYACVDTSGSYPVLCRGADINKDQSYFLFTLRADQLERVMFPLADVTKQQVQQIARRWKLSAQHSTESQDICFIPDNDYVSFLERHNVAPARGGEIVHVNGEIVGRHNGIHRYTIGQRRGLGIAWSEPLYVVMIDAGNNRLIVGEKNHLATSVMLVDNLVWTHQPVTFPVQVDCRIRYRHREARSSVTMLDEDVAQVTFEQPQTGVTPGQAAVFYQNDCVIGGGWIK